MTNGLDGQNNPVEITDEEQVTSMRTVDQTWEMLNRIVGGKCGVAPAKPEDFIISRDETEEVIRQIMSPAEVTAKLRLVAEDIKKQNPKEEVVHPDHYNQYNQYKGFEVIDVCEQLVGPDGKSGFNLGNAFKYIARAGWKNPEKQIQDLEKAVFYLQREVDRLKSGGWMNRDMTTEKTPTTYGTMKAYTNCMDCGIVLVPMVGPKDGFYCPNNHGWLEVHEPGIGDWHEPTMLAGFETYPYCDTCGTALLYNATNEPGFYYCMYGHLRMGVWSIK